MNTSVSIIKTKIHQAETPSYWYDMELLKNTLVKVKTESEKYGFRVHYALKANVNLPILKTISNFGLGADCVSGNEILRAVETGFAKEEIVFAGVGKTDEEILLALGNNIFCFNSESIQEIEVIDELAGSIGKKANIAVRINPDINAKTHENITTGRKNNKFGINFTESEVVISKIQSLNNINFIGIHFHIGSQITDMDVYKNLCKKVNYISGIFEKSGCNIKYINLGGGLGIDYGNPDENKIPDFAGFFSIVDKYLKRKPSQSIHFELGRSIVGQCGNLLTKALYTKKNSDKEYIIVDAGFTELLRPALYKAVHKIENLSSLAENNIYDIAGPICESSDVFAQSISLPLTKRGDYIAIRSTGAYGEVMSSSYNMRKPVTAYYI